MSHYHSFPMAVELVKKEIEVRRYMLTLVEPIKAVLRQFDGKVVNKRLFEALKAIAPHLFARFKLDWFEIEFFARDFEVELPVEQKEDYSRFCTLHSTDKILLWMDTSLCIENKRLKAAPLCEELDKVCERLGKEAAAAETALMTVEKEIINRDNTKTMLDAYNQGIDPILDEYFNLSLNLRY